MCACMCHGWSGKAPRGCRCEGCPYPITDSTVDVPLPSLTAGAPRSFHRLLTEEENALIMHVRGHRHLSTRCQLCVATEAQANAMNYTQSIISG